MFKDSKFRYLLIVPVLLLIMALTIQPVYATEIPGDGVVGADEVINDDVLLGADNPTMLGTVNGMLIMAGNHVLIDGTVNGDVFAFGNYVEIGENAHITGNIFSGGYLIDMAGIVDGSFAGGAYAFVLENSAAVERNLYFGGYSAEIAQAASIGMDASIGTYQTVLHGSIARDLNIGAAAVLIDGSIGRNAIIDVAAPGYNEPPPYYFYSMNQQNEALPIEAQEFLPDQMDMGLIISEDAEIGGKITYVSPQPQSETIQVSPPDGIVYQTPVPDPDEMRDNGQQPIVFQHAERGTASFITGMILTWIWRITKAFITLGLIALLVFWLFPKKFDETVQVLKTKPGKSFGYGILVILGGYVLLSFALLVLICFTAFLAVITFGELGFYFFLISFSCYFLVMAIFLILVSMVSKIVVAYLIGSWLLKSLSKTPVNGRAMPLIVGLVLYIILGFIPILGYLVRTVMTLFGTGAIYLILLDWWNSRKNEKTLLAE
ncbi:MAG: hypothetical protein JEZ00_08265 [Anaerolineaceae bacterium]|nr:hypothetical protein [Anaerolineaceae bacterium]